MQFRSSVRLVLLLIIVLLTGSCGQRLYVPNRVNLPLMRERNEIRLNLNAGNAQLAYSPVKHLALMANGFYRNNETEEHEFCIVCGQNRAYEIRRGRQRLLEGSLGYYKPLPRGRTFEVYGGYGQGRTRIFSRVFDELQDDLLSTRLVTADQKRYFVQANYGGGGEYFQLGVSTRFSAMRYGDLRLTEYVPEQIQAEGLENLEQQTVWLAEPAFTFRYGYKWIMLEWQSGLIISQKRHQELVRPGAFVNLSLSLALAPRFRVKSGTNAPAP